MENENNPHAHLYYDKEVVVEKDGKTYELSIETKDFSNRPDCRIGHFGYNFYFRTRYGLKMIAYKTKSTLESAVVRSCQRNGFKFIRWQTH